jgi:hypothetical protein
MFGNCIPTAVRMHILAELACFATPTQVVTSVKEKFGIEVSRQCVEAHHPERRAGAKLNPGLRALYYETRAKLLAELDDIGLASRAGRLRALDRMAGKAERMGTSRWPCSSSSRLRARSVSCFIDGMLRTGIVRSHGLLAMAGHRGTTHESSSQSQDRNDTNEGTHKKLLGKTRKGSITDIELFFYSASLLLPSSVEFSLISQGDFFVRS